MVSLISTLMIVLIHAYNYTDSFLLTTTRITEGRNICAMIEFGISNGLTRFAVPVFFMISGFLFFFSFDGSFQSYEKKILSRCKSVLLPYLIWTAIWTVVLLILHFCGVKLPEVDSAFTKLCTNTWNYMNYPFAFQLWFLVDLMKLFAIAPLIYFFCKTCKGYPLIVLALLWFFNRSFVINCDGLLFFSLGVYFAVNESAQKVFTNTEKSGLLAAIFLTVSVILVAVFTYLAALGDSIKISDFVRTSIFKCFQATEVIGIWKLFDCIKEKENGLLLRYVEPASFFIFMLHEPLQHMIFQSIITKGSSDQLHITVYFLVALIIIVAVTAFGNLIIKSCPKTASLLTGGRTK